MPVDDSGWLRADQDLACGSSVRVVFKWDLVAYRHNCITSQLPMSNNKAITQQSDTVCLHTRYQHRRLAVTQSQLQGKLHHCLVDSSITVSHSAGTDWEWHICDEPMSDMQCQQTHIANKQYIKVFCMMPVLTTDNVCVIKAGRHPLAEIMTSHTYIPNDTSMGSNSSRVHIITGPNASGKSCYAKQVALITFMAHIGCFVPAESAVIGLTDRIFARSVMGESVAAMSSSFAADVSQISRMVHHATGRSLLVIDEFGKGTLAADGVGLLSSLISRLCEGNNQQGAAASPRVLACTHYHELLDEQVLPRHPCLQFYTMEVITEANDNSKALPPVVQSTGAQSMRARREDKEHEQQDVTFLYRLVEGYCAPSFGISCAKLCGVRDDVVARAQQVLQALESKQPIQVAPQALDQPRCQLYRKAVQELATNSYLLDASQSQQKALSYLLGFAVNESLLSAADDVD